MLKATATDLRWFFWPFMLSLFSQLAAQLTHWPVVTNIALFVHGVLEEQTGKLGVLLFFFGAVALTGVTLTFSRKHIRLGRESEWSLPPVVNYCVIGFITAMAIMTGWVIANSVICFVQDREGGALFFLGGLTGVLATFGFLLVIEDAFQVKNTAERSLFTDRWHYARHLGIVLLCLSIVGVGLQFANAKI